MPAARMSAMIGATRCAKSSALAVRILSELRMPRFRCLTSGAALMHLGVQVPGFRASILLTLSAP